MDEDYGYRSRKTPSLWGALEFFLDLEPLIMAAVIGALIAPIVLYVLVRGRANREPSADTQLGLKFALGYFQTLAYHLLLIGGVLLTFGIIMKSGGDSKEMIYRPALGLLMPAGLLFGVHSWALGRTNRAEYPLVGRMLAGFSLLISGVIGTVAVILVFQILFQKGASGNAGRFFWSLVLVFGTAWVVQAVRFYRRVQLDPLMTPPQPYYPPPPPAGGPVVPGSVHAPPLGANQVQVPLPAPMAAPLAPPGTAPGGTTP